MDAAPAPPLPYEFVVTGTPVSPQTGNRRLLRAWRARVTTAAARDWTAFPLAINLRVTVSYYHAGRAVPLDEDNMLKPIQDALNGLIFVDDAQVTDARVRKSPIDDPIHARFASRVLLDAFACGEPFVHVIIESAPDHSVPLRAQS